MTPSYLRQMAKIDDLLKRVGEDRISEYYMAKLAQLACVQLSAAIEVCLRESLVEYSKSRTHRNVARFVEHQLQSLRNPVPERISQVLKSFDASWEDKLEKYWEGPVKASIGSIVSNRHQIAHGRDSSVTLVRVSEWYAHTRRFFAFFRTEIVQLDV